MAEVDAMATLREAAGFLQSNRPADAERLLRDLTARHGGLGDAHRLLGIALRAQGDFHGAAAALETAVHCDPDSGPSAVVLSETLLALGRPADAANAVSRIGERPDADLHILTAFGNALKAEGRLEAAAAALGRATQAAPGSAVAEHNLAAVLGDLQKGPQSEQAARRAMAKGLDAPETWLVLGRALAQQARDAEAEAAFRSAIDRRPDYVDAHAELAQMIWMRTADDKAALTHLDRAIAAYPRLQALSLKKAEFLENAADTAAGYAAIAEVAAREDAEPAVHVVASRLLTQSDPASALRHAEAAVRATPENPIALANRVEALLALGDAARALPHVEALLGLDPLDQHSLALQATCWRLAGDPRYDALYDFDSLIGTYAIDTPPGWTSLDAFLQSLRESLLRLHTLKAHPIGQSVRGGSQTNQTLTHSTDPVIKAFFSAIDGPIRRHIANLGPGDDPVRRRVMSDYAFNGTWSVRLHSSGFHTDHVHPKGWLSSACYIELPSNLGEDHQGWLRFGRPGIVTRPELPAERYIRPEPGLLALFPSYIWHGVEPFGGDDHRLTIAFDIVPA